MTAKKKGKKKIKIVIRKKIEIELLVKKGGKKENIELDLCEIKEETESGDDVLNENVVKQKIKDLNMFRYDKAVPDETLCLIKKEYRCVKVRKIQKKIDYNNDVCPNCKTIVVLLESPHKSEYDKNLVPKRPLNSNNAREKLMNVIGNYISEKDYFKNGIYRIAIVNPIQFQTSMYEIFKKPLHESPGNIIRDTVWDTLWKQDSIKDWFLERMSILKPEMIVISTTLQFKLIVANYLCNKGSCVPILYTNHPSYKDGPSIIGEEKKEFLEVNIKLSNSIRRHERLKKPNKCPRFLAAYVWASCARLKR